jgi:hypothetical protein
MGMSVSSLTAEPAYDEYTPPNVASSYGPRYDSERNPIREILTMDWCDEHRPRCEGADDERASVGGVALDSSGEANDATNRPWCELVYRAMHSNGSGGSAKTLKRHHDVRQGR